MEVLSRIKHLILQGRYRFTRKALGELRMDDLDKVDALEAIINANIIKKTIRSKSPHRAGLRERLYVIEGFTYRGTLIYTKGKITREAGEEVYYVLISSKRSTYGDQAGPD